MLDLARSQRLVDDHRDAAGGNHAEKRGDGVGTAVEEDPNPVVDLESGRRQRRADGGRTTLEGGVVSNPPPLQYCGERGPSTRRLPQQMGDVGDQTYLHRTRTASPVPREA